MKAAQSSGKIPDLGGAGYGWFSVGDDLLPLPSGPGPVVSDPAHPYQSNTNGRQPTFRIADVSNSILQRWAIDELTTNNRRVLSGKVPFNARERCWPAGVPGFEVFTLLRPVYFLQTPTKVLIINEGDNQVRHVYLNVPHSANPKPSWYGESVGHYENGDMLVVDTIGMNDRSYIDNYLTPHTTRQSGRRAKCLHKRSFEQTESVLRALDASGHVVATDFGFEDLQKCGPQPMIAAVAEKPGCWPEVRSSVENLLQQDSRAQS